MNLFIELVSGLLLAVITAGAALVVVKGWLHFIKYPEKRGEFF